MSKKVMIFAGTNGAGKTTLAYEYLEELSNYVYLSADAIAATLAPIPIDVKIQAGRKFFAKMTTLIATGQNILIESTLSGLGFQRIISRLKQAGYTITISFIYLETPEACIRRVNERVLKGGHDVPEIEIKRRFYRSKKNFWSIYKNQVDFWYLFYNRNRDFIEIAMGQSERLIITDEIAFERFFGDF